MSVINSPSFHPIQQKTTIDQRQFAGKEIKPQDSNSNYSHFFVDETPEIIKNKISIQQLRNAVSDCKLHDSRDEYILKWLSVFGFDVARAEKMLRQTLEWRRVNDVDDIFETYIPREVLKKYYPFGQIGVDKFGCPIFMHTFGRTDLPGILLSSTKKEFSNFVLFMLESYVRATKVETERTGRQITRSTYIFDYECVTFKDLSRKCVLENLIETCKLIFTHYPDSSRRLFIINAPSYFPMVLTLIKPFLHESDVPKIKIIGNNKNEWLAALLEEIEADQLPVHYGGTMTDPDGDPTCPSKFNMGGKVPESYYLSNNAPVAKDYMETMNVMAGGKKKLKFKIDAADSTMSWEFMTEGGDVGFRIYKKDSKDHDNLIPSSRVDSHLIMEEGHIKCHQPGNYVFEFDNSFSYLRAKKIRYHVVVDPPSF
ncbi:SEC14-like protein 2 [Daphnia magna]|nr:SEC14-like protein 2 [Daphnia magna]XP_032781307.1 SEC14-like protein 2 [Daphnia magna]XP_032781322.1 SEC14-like protein 2 [Daphnia magna]XP_032781331.1 SEC14-like protein 2 [Daphnia magna]